MVPTLESSRLLLTPRAHADAENCLLMESDIEVRRYTTPDFRDDFDADKHRSSLHDRIRVDAGRGFGWWIIRHQGDAHSFLGMALLIPLALEGPEIEIGWRLPRSFWGHGYATEAARRVIQYATNDLGLNEIIAWSISVAEKLGFSRNGRKKAYGTEFDCYRLNLHR